MNFSDHIIEFYSGLNKSLPLPGGVELLYPFGDDEVERVVHEFYRKYYSDNLPRYFLFGINPGRSGAGITGIPFTDPFFLEDSCAINNPFPKKNELSSVFIYEMINALGGPESFYSKYYISSVCPLGFLKEGKNYNYYDDRDLLEAVWGFIVSSIDQQVSSFSRRDKAFSIGKGRNFKIFSELNQKHGWFDEIVPLPHPRWVMQYNRKHKSKYIQVYADSLPGSVD